MQNTAYVLRGETHTRVLKLESGSEPVAWATRTPMPTLVSSSTS